MKQAVIQTGIASLMTQPMRECELADEALYGMTVEVMERVSDEWYLIRTPYRYDGYAHHSSLLFDAVLVEQWTEKKKQIAHRPYVDIKREPKVQSVTLLSVPQGALLETVGETDEEGWVRIALCDGKYGYTKQNYLTPQITAWDPAKEDQLRQNIMKEALGYCNTQYRWGGKTHLGIDCSGLCSMAYMLNGIIIFRDAHIKEGFPMREIPREQAKPGDLLFFPGHVAMYLGNGKFIHATSKRGYEGVCVNSLRPGDEFFREDLQKSMTCAGSIFVD